VVFRITPAAIITPGGVYLVLRFIFNDSAGGAFIETTAAFDAILRDFIRQNSFLKIVLVVDILIIQFAAPG
jgi:hypothetical protein